MECLASGGQGSVGQCPAPCVRKKQFWDAFCLLPQRGPVGLSPFPVARSVPHLWGLFSFLLSFSLTSTSGIYPHHLLPSTFLGLRSGRAQAPTPDRPLFWLRRLYQVLLRDPSSLICKMKRTESASTDCRRVAKRYNASEIPGTLFISGHC